MTRVYELEVVKSDGTITVVSESNHLTQIMIEVTWPPYRNGKLPKALARFFRAETYEELRQQILRYPLTATDPWALMK